MKVRNMVSRNSGREVANQFIITDEKRTVFQSYSSTIIEIDWDNQEITIFPDWNYSVTTSKYRNQFMEEYGFTEMGNSKGFKECMKKGKIRNFKIKEV
jgi:hypothetical protein